MKEWGRKTARAGEGKPARDFPRLFSTPTFAAPRSRAAATAGDDLRALRVALMVTARIWGGAEQQAWLLARGLRDRGHQVELYCRNSSPFARRVTADGFDVLEFAGTGRDPFSLWKIRRRLAAFRPHVLHFNDPHAVTTGGLASLRLNLPVRVASRRSSFPIRHPHRYVRWCDGILCVAHEVAQVCRQSGIQGPEVEVVHSGSAWEPLAAGDRAQGRQRLQLEDDDVLLLTVAMLHECKGHRYLLESLPSLVQRYRRLHVALAGEGPMRAALLAQAEQLGIGRHVRFLGHCTDVPNLLQACDVFVMPTIQEGICGALIEAMLAGRPAVTTTVGGIPDVVGTAEEAATRVWPIPPGDSAAISAALTAVLQSPAESAARAARAREHAYHHFTQDCMVENTLAAYGRHLQRSASQRRAA